MDLEAVSKEFYSNALNNPLILKAESRKKVFALDEQSEDLHSQLCLIPEYQLFLDEKRRSLPVETPEQAIFNVCQDVTIAACQAVKEGLGLDQFMESVSEITKRYKDGRNSPYEVIGVLHGIKGKAVPMQREKRPPTLTITRTPKRPTVVEDLDVISTPPNNSKKGKSSAYTPGQSYIVTPRKTLQSERSEDEEDDEYPSY